MNKVSQYSWDEATKEEITFFYKSLFLPFKVIILVNILNELANP